ncbi:MAG: S8 family serine peptidase [Candidatus Rokuibacteriota bacterium]
MKKKVPPRRPRKGEAAGRARPKLDPRLRRILTWPPEVIAQIRESERRLLEARLDDLRRQIHPGPEADDYADRTPGLDPRTTINGVPREVRADRLQYASLLHGVDFRRRADPVASVFIKFRGAPARFERAGVRIHSVAGDIATATVPLRRIPNLEADPDVVFVELSRPAFAQLDQSVSITQADQLHAGMPAVTGQGTIVGIVDYGIDFYHPDFRDPVTQTTRLRFLWHQDPPAGTGGAAGAPPAPWGYGREYSSIDLNQDLVSGNPYSVVDHRADPHGTQVAGIAAGNGAGDGMHIGVAPGADIIFVDTLLSGMLAIADMVQIADALDYVFARAGATPCVVNLSLGDHLGPHDGTSLVEQFIDNAVSTPGRSVAIAAGNGNLDGKYATGTVPSGGASSVALTVPVGVSGAETLEIWYDGPDRFDLSITLPGGTVRGPFLPNTGPVSSVAGTTRITVTSVVNDPRNEDNLISVILESQGGPIAAGNWQVSLGGNVGGTPSVINGRWNAWIDRNTAIAWAAPAAGTLTLATPGTCRRAITVGAHDKIGGQLIWGKSGRGSTRDGRIKPEISAPGVSIVAPRARNMTAPVPGPLYEAPRSGTSLAAPHVAGAIALLHECRAASLSTHDAKYILQTLADTQGIASIPDLAFGWGRVRVANACVWAIQGPDVWLKTNPADTGVEPYTGPAFWQAPDIWVRPNRDGGLVHGNPRFGQENHVHVIVRNRGLGPAFNTQAYLYWADPGTNIPFSAWRREGIRVGLQLTNVQVIPQLNPGASTQTPQPFSWFPPAPGSNLGGDDHFCLLVRLENESDPANVGPGGWQSVRDHNNIALKNVHVVNVPPGASATSASFYMFGEGGWHAMRMDGRALPDGARMVLQLPLHAIDLSSYRVIERAVGQELLRVLLTCHAAERARLAAAVGQRLMKAGVTVPGRELEQAGTIFGVAALRFVGPTVRLEVEGATAVLNRLALPHEKIPVRIGVQGPEGLGEKEWSIDVEHWVNGNSVGGLTTVFRPRRAV